MGELREHPRHITKIKVEFENCDTDALPSSGEYSPSCAGFGHTIDISLGGVLMTCSTDSQPNDPVSLCFYLSGKESESGDIRFLTRGTVVRAGSILDIAEEFREHLAGEFDETTRYMAVKFANPLFELSSLLNSPE